ncbi:MAG TPA: SDR family NAD(P)-dependent oxidoreductase [Roseiflexaceae bacterium]|nr:SDR family NAD(P)-dependent oxidoreductase [Roseiflexaceae bacterium]
MTQDTGTYSMAVAIIGMSGRFPGAPTVAQFWQNLAAGVCSIRRFSDEELLAAGVLPELLRQPNYVKAGTVIEGVEAFDAAFFGYSPREAEVMDPQHRLFLECAWEALEQAAYDPERYAGLIGVFAGSGFPSYMTNNLASNPGLMESVGALQIAVGNERDSLASTVSYKLNLRGPGVSVQTFCSTSLVAVHLAYQSLITYECDMALAGGVAISIPQVSGYVYQEGGIVSPDGSCRTFDAEAKGSVMGNGLGVVALKRLQEAIDDGDPIYAVIRGSATNNDGVRKVGYTAPGLGGQASVIMSAMLSADVAPDSIGYIEAHGTATPLGDSVELAALLQAFATSGHGRRSCALGSVKPNIGHLDRASGVTGLIKTALMLAHKQIPPQLNFARTGPDIDLDSSPFVVSTELRDWPAGPEPRRAGVNSFGLGGTNAHVVLEEAPARPPSDPGRPYQLLVLSAKTEAALEAMTDNLAAHCRANPDQNPSDLAYTLQVGRAAFNYRRTLVCRDLADAAEALERREPRRVQTMHQVYRNRPVALMFPGVGDHSVGMARDLYGHEPAFRATVDRCCALLLPLLGQDLRALLYPAEPPAAPAAPAADLRAMLGRGEPAGPAGPLHQTLIAQPAVFVIEYALARLLLDWGLKPQALIGYSLGEYVAACISGVLSLEDALRLVAARARLIQEQPSGAMLAVALNEYDLRPYLDDTVGLAALNSPSTCVLGGPAEAIGAVAERLLADGVACRRVETTHAFHTDMLAAAAGPLTELVASVRLQPPQIPYISNVTGTWITPEQATDPAYWAAHMCQPVRFAEGAATLLKQPRMVLLEVGPGQALGSFVRQHPACDRERAGLVLGTLRAAHETRSDVAGLLGALGLLWMLDVPLSWGDLYKEERRYRLALPTYPFERQRYWVAPGELRLFGTQPRPASLRRPDPADWFYVPEWTAAAPVAAGPAGQKVLLLGDDQGFCANLARLLEQEGHRVVRAVADSRFTRRSSRLFGLRPDSREDYAALLESLELHGLLPQTVVHAWNLAGGARWSPDEEGFRAALAHGFGSLLALAQALGERDFEVPLALTVLTHAAQPVSGQERLSAEQAPLLGLCKVVTQEYEQIVCRSIDLALPPPGSPDEQALAARLAVELPSRARDPELAYRAGERLARGYRPVRLEPPAMPHPARLRPEGVYLITGGLGGIGPHLAAFLARSVGARIALVGRSELPRREEWAACPDSHPAAARIKQIQAIEALGGEVLALQADVADEAQMRAAVEQTIARFGALHGVIYAAGASDGRAFGLLQEQQLDGLALHFPPKVYGLYVLERVTAALTLDFCVLFSSISSILGGLSFGGYVAANAFIDLFTQRHNQHSQNRWLCINWDTWRIKANAHGPLGATIAQYEMSPEEGVEAFARALGYGGDWLINSTGDLQTRIRQWVLLETRQAPSQAGGGLGAHARPALETPFVLPTGDYERRIAAVLQQVLGIEQVGLHDNFFDLGGNSLNGLQVIARLKKEFKVQMPAVVLFEAPTVSALAQYLRPQTSAQGQQQEQRLRQRRARTRQNGAGQDIAIISMAGRFPGARTVEQLWQNLCDGVESIASFSEAEVLAAGVDPQIVHDPAYVRARPVLDDVEHFDAAFFGYTPREAALMDPQQRLFHECAWEALEQAGYDTQRYPGLVGVFAGANLSSYLLNLVRDPEIAVGIREITILENDKDALATNVAYKLNLRGPGVAVQTFCSTSLVAVHLACRSLLGGECDMALAGGVSVRVPVRAGYLHQEGGLTSPEGRCRTFDAAASGSVYGDGVAVVMLKRLADALEDGDTVHAVIKGSAINNDGALKLGYTAPSVAGQVEVIVSALDQAGVDPATIGYVEAHGTGTRLGDPIEVVALTKAYRTFTEERQFCAIASLKPNIGHLDRAAGATGLIKTVMMLKHGLIPPLLHFRQSNPEIDFASSPFFVPTALRPWPAGANPRRAAVNAQGTGGTNAHVIVEAAPEQASGGPSRPYQLLLLSATSPAALEAQTDNLRRFLDEHLTDLPDVAYTLQVGRRVFEQRRMLVCQDRDEAVRLLRGADSQRLFTFGQKPVSRQVVWLFSGVDTPHVGIAQELYQYEPTFRAVLDRCARLVQGLLDLDIRAALYPDLPGLRVTDGPAADAPPEPSASLARADVALVAGFAVNYALAQLLLEWGQAPQAILGYRDGEYLAACLSGVLSFEDALQLLGARAGLLGQQPPLDGLRVDLGPIEVQGYLDEQVRLLAVIGPQRCLLGGPASALAQARQRLAADGIGCAPQALAPADAPTADSALAAAAQHLTLRPPRIPCLSNVTGDWLTADQATDPGYWCQPASRPARLDQAVQRLLEREEFVLLSVGVCQQFAGLIAQHPLCSEDRLALFFSTLREAHEDRSDLRLLLTTLGKLWLLNVPVDWVGFAAHEQRRRIPLPTYPFERQRFWLEPQPQRSLSLHGRPERRQDVAEWFTTVSWRRATPCAPAETQRRLAAGQTWLILSDRCGVGAALQQWLGARGQTVVRVSAGQRYEAVEPGHQALRPDRPADYQTLLADLAAQGRFPDQIVHLWAVTPPGEAADPAAWQTLLAQGAYSLIALAEALDAYPASHCRISVVSTGLQEVTGGEELCPAKAPLLGPCQAIPQEHQQLSVRSIDLLLPASGGAFEQAVEQLALELLAADVPATVALRGQHRWFQTMEPTRLAPPVGVSLRRGGVYLITGALSDQGLALARMLAAKVGARLALLDRGLPPREQWEGLPAAPELLLLDADPSDPALVAAAVQHTREHFGALHGVFHCAGPTAPGLNGKTLAGMAAALAPVIGGTVNLARALDGVPLDALVLCFPALGSLTGGLGQADACAAQAFLEAYARKNQRAHGHTLAIGWGPWRACPAPDLPASLPESLRRSLSDIHQTYGMSDGEVMEALERALGHTLPHVYVTTQEVAHLLALGQQLRAGTAPAQSEAEQPGR